MRVSVVIPALNERQRIEAAIEAARHAGADEVIVADGGSEDGTCELVRSLDCQLVSSPAGRARQQNAGAEVASGDVLVFQHADNRFSTGCIEQIRQVMQAQERCVCGAFRQRIDDPRWRFRLREWGNRQRVRWFRMAYGDQGIFVRRETFWEQGGFPEVPLMEDVMLMKRLRKLRRPVLLPGPLLVDARRWQRHGVVRQTLRNWYLLAAFKLGVSPERLSRHYRRHDR